MNEQELQMTA